MDHCDDALPLVKLDCLMVPTLPLPSRMTMLDMMSGMRLWESLTIAFHSFDGEIGDSISLLTSPATILFFNFNRSGELFFC